MLAFSLLFNFFVSSTFRQTGPCLGKQLQMDGAGPAGSGKFQIIFSIEDTVA